MRIAGFMSVLCLVFGMAGCGGEKLGTPVDVPGKITVDGAPGADLTVTFHAMTNLSAEHRTRQAKTDSQGAYKLEKVYPGNYQVMVAKPMASDLSGDPGKIPAEFLNDPLAKYGAESTLSAKIPTDKPSLDFELKTK